jgi:membrane-associated phospholipid phosphatase
MRKWVNRAFRLRPEELLPVIFFVPSVLITLKAISFYTSNGQTVPPRFTHGVVRLGITALAMLLFAFFVKYKPYWRHLGWVRDVAPFLFCIAVYTNLHDTIHFINPHDVHDELIRIDQALFGVQPCVWAQRLYHPLLTDIFSVAYMNYFVISVAVVVWLLIERRRTEMREALFGTILCFYFGYVLYVLFPAAPPRLVLASQFTRDFSGGWLTQAQMRIIDINPTSARGAFPSLHCAVTFITLFYAYKFRKTLFALLLLPGTALVLATVYLRHHYVIDIIAGLALAIFCFFVAPSLNRAWSRLQERALRPGPQALTRGDRGNTAIADEGP